MSPHFTVICSTDSLKNKVKNVRTGILWWTEQTSWQLLR